MKMYAKASSFYSQVGLFGITIYAVQNVTGSFHSNCRDPFVDVMRSTPAHYLHAFGDLLQ